ncbi:MAG: RagB/SusD family nutrient uptake outer membrane protein [Candidatus Symbiothrix sp.]|jgi:hypothetical protein|nr:RagB/SusD family nutrient uptake outer membrane protein [Candidatus Symbiothrix sp.]
MKKIYTTLITLITLLVSMTVSAQNLVRRIGGIPIDISKPYHITHDTSTNTVTLSDAQGTVLGLFSELASISTSFAEFPIIWNADAALIVNNLIVALDSHPNTLYRQGLGGETGIKMWYGNFAGNAFAATATTNYGASNNIASGNFHEDAYSDYTSFPWYYYYNVISNANTVIATVDAGSAENQKLKAQALTFRAYAYTMLVQLYGYRWSDSNNGATPGVVLRLDSSSDPMPLSSIADIYNQIYADLDAAIVLFQSSGWTRGRGATEIGAPNINVAYATYARAAINKLDYGKAIEMAQKAREGYPLMTVDEYNSGFNTPNQEWIWGSYADDTINQAYYGYHSNLAYDGYAAKSTTATKVIVKDYYEKIPATDIRRGLFLDPNAAGVLPDYVSPINGTVYTPFDPLNGEVLAAISEGTRPNVTIIPRGNDLIDLAHTNFPALLPSQKIYTYMQFKVSTDGVPNGAGVGCTNHFRSSEMYLIEAEAQYKSGNENRAQQLLVELTKDSGRDTSFTCTETGSALFDKIKFTAQIELWGEGFDWFMTKRWGDPIVHKSFADGGNYLDAVGGFFGPEYANKQTWVIPALETAYNPLAKGLAQ